MVDADCRQRNQSLKKTGKLVGIDIQLGVPADQFMNPPRHAFQMMNFFRTTALDVETDGANACGSWSRSMVRVTTAAGTSRGSGASALAMVMGADAGASTGAGAAAGARSGS